MAAIIGAAEGKDSLPCHRFSCDGQAAAVPGPAASGRARIATASLARPCAAQASTRQKYAGADIEKFARARVDAPHKAYDVAVKLWKQLQTGGCIQRVLVSGI